METFLTDDFIKNYIPLTKEQIFEKFQLLDNEQRMLFTKIILNSDEKRKNNILEGIPYKDILITFMSEMTELSTYNYLPAIMILVILYESLSSENYEFKLLSNGILKSILINEITVEYFDIKLIKIILKRYNELQVSFGEEYSLQNIATKLEMEENELKLFLDGSEYNFDINKFKENYAKFDFEFL